MKELFTWPRLISMIIGFIAGEIGYQLAGLWGFISSMAGMILGGLIAMIIFYPEMFYAGYEWLLTWRDRRQRKAYGKRFQIECSECKQIVDFRRRSAICPHESLEELFEL